MEYPVEMNRLIELQMEVSSAEADLHRPARGSFVRHGDALSARPSTCRASKGAAGWEFTDLGKLDLDAFGPAPADAELTLPEALFEAPVGISLTQVDGNKRGRRGRPRRLRS